MEEQSAYSLTWGISWETFAKMANIIYSSPYKNFNKKKLAWSGGYLVSPMIKWFNKKKKKKELFGNHIQSTLNLKQ